MERVRSIIAIAVCAILLALLTGACTGGGSGNGGSGASAEASKPEEKTVVDNAGHQVAVPVRPQRVIAPYLEDPLVVLGVKPVAQVLYGNVEQNYLKDSLPEVEIIDTSDVGLPLERLLNLSPDLLILGKGMAAEEGVYEQYAKIAPSYVVDNIDKSWRETLLDLAGLLGKEQTAEEQLAEYDRKIQQTRAHVQRKIGNGTAAIVVLTDKEFYTMGHVQGGALLFDELGVRPHPLTPEQEEWNTLSLEKLSELDADYIFVIKTERYQVSELENNSLWKGLPAVRAGRVHDVESGIWQYSGLISNERKLADIMQAIPE